jgi:hypothetical protein
VSLFLFPTPRTFWSQPDVASAVDQAHDAARRIAKGVNAGRERRRLGAALQTIERAVRIACPNPRVLTAAEAETALHALPRVGTTRMPFYVGGEGEGTLGGFLLAPIPFQADSTFSPLGPVPSVPPLALTSRAAAHGRETEGGHGHRGTRERLILAIADARADGRAVSLGPARHSEIATAMRTYLHRDAQPAFIQRFVYSDGSLSGPVSLAKLQLRNAPAPYVELALGLNSCRHFELDPIVDLYLLRTAEFDRHEGGSFADQEAFAYGRAQALLQRYADQVLRLRLYHTGLEPAAIGVYRAVIDRLLAGQNLVVTPVHHPRNPDEEEWW